MSYRLSIILALLAIQVGWLNLSWLVAFGTTLGIYLVSGGWRFARLLLLTLPRDLRYFLTLIKGIRLVKKAKSNNWTVCDIFQDTAKKYKGKVAFVFEDKYWTFQEVEYFSNKIANYFQSIGYKKGDVVALFLENRPELVFFWLGLAKIGVISSLVNYNLRKESLTYCITIVKAKGLIYSADTDIADAVADISSNLSGIELFQFGSGDSKGIKSESISEAIEQCSENPPPPVPEKDCDDVLFYIYTSGTTGLPKASVIRHFRFFTVAFSIYEIMKIRSDDVFYCTLPLYHSSAGMLGVGYVITNGTTLVVRKKFSASRFWDDCIHYKATGAIYVGEICRYLLTQPMKEIETKHSLRFMMGNGLRPQIWNEFKTRFHIPSILEFYGATEGNIGLFNTVNQPGAIGFLPVIFEKIYPIRLFKMDSLSGELLRGHDGLCVPCGLGEVGHIAGWIDERDKTRRFDGYVNKEASSKKVARDVMKKGDQWFISGDAMYLDELGFVYFHDRLGDTFRWRGENVSTTEVEGAILKAVGFASVIVYGVEVPGCEGRAGMAAIEDPEHVVDVRILGKKLSEVLPAYARPVFLRITNSVDKTGTFKFQKTRYRKEGFDLSNVKDKLYFFDLHSREYCVLTNDIYRKISDGEIRV